MSDLTFRPANPADIDTIVDIIVGEPNQISTNVILQLYGVEDAALAKQIYKISAEIDEVWRKTTLAERNGVVVGVLQVPNTAVSSHTLGKILKTAFVYLPQYIKIGYRLFGLRFMSEGRKRTKLQQHVQVQAPPDAYKIGELHVVPTQRGQGIGSQMLNYAKQDARAHGYSQMALRTWTTNPAVRLYERHGFEIVQTSTNKEFENLTGASGNYLMVKNLQP
ncbi:MAG: GNAT family N-acetyltransferase [Chloroflexota bacterium]